MHRILPPLFSGLNDVDVHTALRRFVDREVPAGRTIIEAGSAARELVCVVDGALEVRAGDRVVGQVGAGDVVGEMGLFDDAARTASVITTQPTRLLVLKREGYEELRDVLHPIATAIEKRALTLQAERLRALGDRVAQLSDGPTRRPGPGFFASLSALFGRGGLTRATDVDVRSALRHGSLFASAPDAALDEIAEEMIPQRCGAGHLLCVEGEVGTTCWELVSGEVEVVVATDEDRVQPVATLQPGAAFGMLSLAQERPRMATCIAKTPVVVLTLQRPGWRRLAEGPWIAGSVFRRAMIRVLGEQLSRTNALLAELEAKAEERDAVLLARAGAGVEVRGS